MKPIQYKLFSLWLLVVVSFFLGISLPIATVEKFYFFANEFSILSSMVTLTEELNVQNIVLLIIIFSFTLVFPIAKLTTMFLQIAYYGNNWHNRMTRIIESVGHFSMLDVFVIALTVLLLKLRVLVDVMIHSGFYWFTSSIILSLLLSQTIKHLRQRQVEKIKK